MELLDPHNQPRFQGIKPKLVRNCSITLADKVRELCEESTIERVPPGQVRADFYSRYFIVPKKNGGIHPILNCRPFKAIIKQTLK